MWNADLHRCTLRAVALYAGYSKCRTASVIFFLVTSFILQTSMMWSRPAITLMNQKTCDG